jgi:hypothetical protein
MPFNAATLAGVEWVPTSGTGPNSQTRDLTFPNTTADGDWLVAYAVLSQDDTAATGITGDSFTVNATFPRKTTSPNIGISAILTRIWRDGDPLTYTFRKTGSTTLATFSVVGMKVPGASNLLSTPTATDQTAVGTAVTCPAITVPSNANGDSLVIRAYHTYYYNAAKVNTDTWAITNLTGFTEYADQSGDWASVGMSARLVTSGSVAAQAATAGGSQAGAAGRGVTLCLQPAAAAAVGPESGRMLLAA